jgi:hypothetical protein
LACNSDPSATYDHAAACRDVAEHRASFCADAGAVAADELRACESAFTFAHSVDCIEEFRAQVACQRQAPYDCEDYFAGCEREAVALSDCNIEYLERTGCHRLRQIDRGCPTERPYGAQCLGGDTPAPCEPTGSEFLYCCPAL